MVVPCRMHRDVLFVLKSSDYLDLQDPWWGSDSVHDAASETVVIPAPVNPDGESVCVKECTLSGRRFGKILKWTMTKGLSRETSFSQ